MNTRLQVEHPVTEETTGLDLVELQLDVADGRPAGRPNRLPHMAIRSRRGSTPRTRPRTGSRRPAPCTASTCPRAGAEFGPLGRAGVRVDSGIVDGSAVSVFYDPMLAKVISYAPTPRQAAGILADALARTRLHGIRTNRDLLVNVLRHPAFLDGATDTAFFDTHGLASWPRRWPTPPRRGSSALAAALADAAENRATATVFARPAQRLAQPRVGLPDQALRRRGRRRARRPLPVHPRRAGAARTSTT